MTRDFNRTTFFALLRRRRWSVLFGSLSLAVLIVLAVLMPPVWELKDGPIDVVRWPKSGAQHFLIGPNEKGWTQATAVSKHVVNAIVVAEDARFYEHFGLDIREIRSSIAFNMEKKRYARGASTITQQVVKMAYLDNDKNILRKFREALGALLLECLLDKDEILSWYINLVEFGDGIFGINAASHHFFQTSPELLTIQNGTHLAMILPSPNRWGKALKQQELTEYGQRRYATIIDQMQRQGFITQALRDAALATGNFGKPIQGYVPPVSNEEPDDAPYFAIPGQEPPPFGIESKDRKTKASQVRAEQRKSKKL